MPKSSLFWNLPRSALRCNRRFFMALYSCVDLLDVADCLLLLWFVCSSLFGSMMEDEDEAATKAAAAVVAHTTNCRTAILVGFIFWCCRV